jgi:hypothetical protein
VINAVKRPICHLGVNIVEAIFVMSTDFPSYTTAQGSISIAVVKQGRWGLIQLDIVILLQDEVE